MTKDNFAFLLAYFKKHYLIYQYVPMVFFAKYFLNNVKRGTAIRAHFMLYFKKWLEKK